MDLKRKVYDRLLGWKNENGRTAMLIAGARRVGKSYIAERFAQNEYRSYILVDFSKASPELKDIFTNEQADLDQLFAKLSLLYETRLYPRQTLLVFDEVQLFPVARQLIKHLVADGRFDYLETGSLLTIRSNTKGILLPSEEEETDMHPLDFEEFCWARGDFDTTPRIAELFAAQKPVGQAVHRKLMNDYRTYMLVGGMPQAVLRHLETNSLEEADKVKRHILRLYRNDITKFGERNVGKVSAVFEGIPSQLTSASKKYRLAAVSESARFREYQDAFYWLADAKIVNQALNTSDPSVGLKLSSDPSTMKCYLLDTGLLVTQALEDQDFIHNDIYRSILLGKLGINEGMFVENSVAQALAASGHKLYFYSKTDNQDGSNTMEVDFLVTQGKKVCPIEVKSGAYRAARSLDKFKQKFGGKVGRRYIVHTKDLQVEGDLLRLPLYMAQFL